MGLHIAMWSGPRNISTALMRSFDSRADTYVSDEPLYAAYLRATKKPHPMAREILAQQENDSARVTRTLAGPIPNNCSVWFQKHMTHHLLPETDRAWLHNVEHAFLIRQPRAMLVSLAKKLGEVSLEDTGLPQQAALHGELHKLTGKQPPVVVASELLADPSGVLTELCRRLGLAFDPAMLSWEPGPRSTDGCWGPVWYEHTYASTKFAAPRQTPIVLPKKLEPLALECEALFAELAQHRIQAGTHNA